MVVRGQLGLSALGGISVSGGRVRLIVAVPSAEDLPNGYAYLAILPYSYPVYT